MKTISNKKVALFIFLLILIISFFTGFGIAKKISSEEVKFYKEEYLDCYEQQKTNLGSVVYYNEEVVNISNSS